MLASYTLLPFSTIFFSSDFFSRSQEFESEISSTDMEEEGGDSSEEEGNEEDIVNENKNTRNIAEMLLTVSEVTKPILTKSAVSDQGLPSVCQLQANGTQGFLCLDWYQGSVCACLDNAECVCHDLRTQCVCQL